MNVWCSLCELPIEFSDGYWRHSTDPLRDLEHQPAPDVGLLSVRRANA